MILKSNGTLWASGDNAYGQLGTGDTVDRNVFEQVLTEVADVATGHYHTIALKKDGSLWSTGKNDMGQLGNGTKNNAFSFCKIMSNVAAISHNGGDHTTVLKEDGTIWGFGKNELGELGDYTSQNQINPIEIQKIFMLDKDLQYSQPVDINISLN